MKRLSLLLSLVSLLLGQECFGASTTNAVLFYNRDFQINPQSTRQNFVYFLGAPGVSGTNLITRDRIVKVSNSNGYFGLTNYVPGSYRVEHQGTYAATTNYFIFPDTNGVISAADWIVNAVSTTTPSSSPFVLNSSGNATNLQLWGTASAHSNAKLQFGSQVISNNLDDGALTFWDVGNGIGAAINGGIFYGDGSELTNLARVAGGNVDIVYSTGLSATTNGHRVTVTGTGTNSSSGGTSFTNSLTLWVDPAGTDSTATRGVRELPWANLELAASNAVAGDTILVMPGTYRVTNGVFLPKGGAKLIADGWATIESYATNAATLKAFGVVLTDNSIVENFAISNMHKSTRYQLAIGHHNNLNWGVTLTNVVLRNLVLDGDSDCFFIKASNTVQIAMYDVRAYSKWDAMVMIGESGYTPSFDWSLFNCLAVVATESVFTPGMSGYTHALGFDGNPRARMLVVGGYFASTNNSMGQVWCSRAGTLTSCDLTFIGAKFIGTNWFTCQDMVSPYRIRMTGCQTEGTFSQPSLDTQGDLAMFTDNAWAIGTNGLAMYETLNVDPGNRPTTWTNAWTGDGGLNLGGTNWVGKNNLRVGRTARVVGNITNDALTASQTVFTDANKALTSSGTVDPLQGGTGLNTYWNTNQMGFLYLSGTNPATFSFTTNNGGAGGVLHRGNNAPVATTAPYWSKVNLTSGADVTGVLTPTFIDWSFSLSSSSAVVTDSSANPTTSATTATEIGWLNNRTGAILTNGESVSTVFSNALSVDVTHNLVASNGIYSQFSFVTNTPAGSYVYMTNGSMTLSNFQTGGFIRMTNDSIGITNGANFVTITNGASTNSGSVQAASFVAPFVNNATVLSAGSGSSGFNVKARNDAAGNITINRFDNTAMFAATPSDFSVAGTLGFGSASLPSDVFFTRDAAATAQMGADAATPTAQVLKGPDGSGTDKTGGAMTFAGGVSTGTGRGGAVQLQTSSSATTGSSANTLQTRVYISAKDTALTDATATTVATFTLANSKYCGLKVSATSHADNGTDFQATSDFFSVGLVNKAGTVTVGTLSTVTTSTGASTGTLPTTWTVTASGTTVSVKVSADTSFASPTTFGCKWRLEVDSDDTALSISPQ